MEDWLVKVPDGREHRFPRGEDALAFALHHVTYVRIVSIVMPDGRTIAVALRDSQWRLLAVREL